MLVPSPVSSPNQWRRWISLGGGYLIAMVIWCSHILHTNTTVSECRIWGLSRPPLVWCWHWAMPLPSLSRPRHNHGRRTLWWQRGQLHFQRLGDSNWEKMGKLDDNGQNGMKTGNCLFQDFAAHDHNIAVLLSIGLRYSGGAENCLNSSPPTLFSARYPTTLKLECHGKTLFLFNFDILRRWLEEAFFSAAVCSVMRLSFQWQKYPLIGPSREKCRNMSHNMFWANYLQWHQAHAEHIV